MLKRQKGSFSALFIAMFFLFSAVVAVLPIPSAFAAPTVTEKSKLACIVPCSTVGVAAFTATVNDLMVVSFQFGNTNGRTVSSVTSSHCTPSLVVGIANFQRQAGVYTSVYIYACVITSGTNAGVTVTLSGTEDTFFAVEVITINDASISATALCTAKGKGANTNTSATIQTTTSCAMAAGTAVASEFGFNPVTAGTSYTAYYGPLQGGGDSTNRLTEYSTTASSPTSFPSSQAAGQYLVVGAVFGNSATVISITACTYFQLQCWWYPLLFMGCYSGVLLVSAQALRVGPKGKAHIFLTAITMGSLVAVILGVMNIVFPLMMLVLNTVIALRLR